MVWLDYGISLVPFLKVAEADVMIWCAPEITGENGAGLYLWP